MSTSNEGVLVIQFSEKFKIPSNLTLLNETVLEILLLPNHLEYSKYLQLTKWEVIDF